MFTSKNHLLFATAIVAILGSVSVSAQSNILGIKGGEHTTVGIYIKDIKADTMVFAHDAERSMTPASVTKSLTTASAMTLLGEDFQFTTPVYLSGSQGKDGHWKGALVVEAGGDPTLQSSHFEEWGGICDSIVARLGSMNIKSIEGGVLIQSDMPEQGPATEWEIDDVPWGYGAGHFDLNWRDNVFTLKTASGKTEPHVPGLKVTKISKRRSNLKRGFNSNHLYVYGPRLWRKSNSVHTSMPNPAEVFRYELTQKLNDAGIEVGSKKSTYKERYDVYTHKSAPLHQVMRSLMLRSDNLFAEGVLRAMAPDSVRSHAVELEMELWRSRGIDLGSVAVIDGSGLARSNCFSPHFIGDVLEYMAQHEDSLSYLNLFALVGVNGTVRSFMADTPLKGRLALKTGSMNRVQTYAGYMLDENGSPSHVVVVFANNFHCSRAELRQGITQLLLDKLTEALPEEEQTESIETEDTNNI